MKHIGIVRNIDHLGRIVLPKELRRTLQLDAGTPLDISLEGDTILLKKHQPEGVCVLCGRTDPNAVSFRGSWVCNDCLMQLHHR